ncbi:MAG: hypothetical protein ACREC5_00490 [Thermoplasmata archaeon]
MKGLAEGRVIVDGEVGGALAEVGDPAKGWAMAEESEDSPTEGYGMKAVEAGEVSEILAGNASRDRLSFLKKPTVLRDGSLVRGIATPNRQS